MTVKMQKVIKDGEIWVQTINDDGALVHEELLTEFGAEPVQPTFELPPVEEKRKLSKRGKFTIAIAGGALVTAVIVMRRHKRRERA